MFGLWNRIKKIRKNPVKKNVIRKKLLLYFLVSAILVNSICLYTYNNTRMLISRLNQIFINDIDLTNLSGSVINVEASLKAYLTTNDSEDLEDYLDDSYKLSGQADKLSTTLSNDESELLLVDIKGMISTYLGYTEAAAQEKRGRDINGYSADFNNASQIYSYINSYIDKLKIYEFQENNTNYLQLDSRLGMLQIFNILVILIAMIANIILIFWFSYSLTEPIIKLSKAAGEIADGNYDIPDVNVSSNDEVTTLSVTFNRMTDSIRKQLVEIKQKAEIEIRLHDEQMQNLKMKSMLDDAQLKSLQAQINPHFMFNTLNAGMQLALFEGAERTQAFMEKLSESLRYNLGNMDKSATLSLEITNIDNYIYLLKERFGDKINYVKRIEDGLPQIQVPRMILQPIVENAFLHGISEKEAVGVISLSAERNGDMVLVSVADNGPGMDERNISSILGEDYKKSPIELDAGSKTGFSIGLRNVIGRLMLYYGAVDTNEVIEIESSPGSGTKFTLKLPIKRPEET
jgi:sensor histidine kinase YesM